MKFRILPQAWVSVSGKLEKSEWNNKNPELGTQSALSYSLDCDLGQGGDNLTKQQLWIFVSSLGDKEVVFRY